MKLIKLLFAVIVGLVITNVTLTNRSVDESIVLSDLNAEISKIQNENTILRSQVAEAGSLGNLSFRLAEAGFTTSPTIVSISTPVSVATR